jgi:NADPH:quinone reductase-like Zn-dependent oxidoreductase
MKAFYLSKFGSTSFLKIKDIPKPTPGKNEVLLKMKATAVNDYDWSMITGRPYAYRLMFGFFKPRNPVPGMEIAGVVEAIGEGVLKFKVGDAVFGDTSDFGFGTMAEYMAIHENALTLKPENLSFEEAATLPHAALLAWQGLVEMGKIKKGQKILINGAGGGVGTFALYIAKTYNCHVTGVDTGAKLSNMKAIGFDEVIDYKKTDFTKGSEKYDLILDAKTCKSPFSYAKALHSNGKYITVGGYLNSLLQMLFLKSFVKQSFQILALKPNKGIENILKLWEDGKIKTVIDGPYSFEQTPQAIQRFGDAVHAGKVVIRNYE